MEFKLGQKVKVKDSGVIYEITTNFENGQRIKIYSIISDIDNERICLSENKIERVRTNKNVIKNIIAILKGNKNVKRNSRLWYKFYKK